MRFPLTYWYGVPKEYMFTEHDGILDVNEDRLMEQKDAGFTLINGEYGTEGNKKVLEACEKYDLKMMVIDTRIYECISHPEKAQAQVAAIVKDYSSYPALWGYYITDEPNTDNFPALKVITDRFKALDPSHITYINLFPNYATAAQLGSSTYYEHVEEYIKTVKPSFLSYDHYHFLNMNRQAECFDFDNEREAMIYASAQNKTARGGFFDNLEDVRKLSLAYDIPFMLIVLLVEHGPYRYLSEAELRFEVFQAIAYGAKGMSYFTYWTPVYEKVWRYRNAMITQDGKKTPHYYDAARITHELSILKDEIEDKKSVAVFHIGEEKENVTFFSPFGGIEDIQGGRITAGFFEYGYVILANKDFENSANISIKTDNLIELFDIALGDWHRLPKCSIYSLSLSAGNAKLIRCV